MPFEGEPRNGDYAAYVDRLVNQGVGAPGAQRISPLPPAPTPFPPTSTQAPAAAPPAPTASHTPQPPVQTQVAQPTLAELGTRQMRSNSARAFSMLFMILGVISAIAALGDEEPLSMRNIMRTLIPLFIAQAVYRSSREDARQAQVPKTGLPPFVARRRDNTENSYNDQPPP
jgi:hypothetical protein